MGRLVQLPYNDVLVENRMTVAGGATARGRCWLADQIVPLVYREFPRLTTTSASFSSSTGQFFNIWLHSARGRPLVGHRICVLIEVQSRSTNMY